MGFLFALVPMFRSAPFVNKNWTSSHLFSSLARTTGVFLSCKSWKIEKFIFANEISSKSCINKNHGKQKMKCSTIGLQTCKVGPRYYDQLNYNTNWNNLFQVRNAESWLFYANHFLWITQSYIFTRARQWS